VGVFLGILAGLYGAQTVIALTRGDEEAGLREVVWAGALRRQLPLLVAATGTALGCVLLGAVVTCVLVGVGAVGTGAVLLGAGVAAVGLTFTGVGALVAQFVTSRRAANAIAGALLGLSYLVRMAADAEPARAWLAWFSPLGWLARVEPYAGDRVGPLVLALVVAGAAFTAAWWLEGRRDLGAGFLHARPGPPGSPWLRTPEALAVRLYASTVVGWTLGLAVAAAVVAGIANDVAAFVGREPGTAVLVARMGGSADLAKSYLSGTYQFLGLLVAVVAALGVLGARREEATGRAELVLALPVSRPRWLGSHLGAGIGGALCAVAGTALAGVLASGSGESLAAAANALPGAVFSAGLACALVGLVPRIAIPAGLAIPVVAFFVEYLGRLANLPPAVLAVSPFHYVAAVPAQPFHVAGAVGLVTGGVVLALVGMLTIRRRDVVTA
jgi:ABC-2 type transport system permease protein